MLSSHQSWVNLYSKQEQAGSKHLLWRGEKCYIIGKWIDKYLFSANLSFLIIKGISSYPFQNLGTGRSLICNGRAWPLLRPLLLPTFPTQLWRLWRNRPRHGQISRGELKQGGVRCGVVTRRVDRRSWRARPLSSNHIDTFDPTQVKDKNSAVVEFTLACFRFRCETATTPLFG